MAPNVTYCLCLLDYKILLCDFMKSIIGGLVAVISANYIEILESSRRLAVMKMKSDPPTNEGRNIKHAASTWVEKSVMNTQLNEKNKDTEAGVHELDEHRSNAADQTISNRETVRSHTEAESQQTLINMYY